MRWHHIQHTWEVINHQRQQHPNAEQHHFAAQVKTHFDFFLERVGGVVHMVIAQGFKKEMARLPRHHRHQPSQQSSPSRIDKQQGIRNQKTNRTEQMQRLIDAAVVVIAMVIPTLNAQGF